MAKRSHPPKPASTFPSTGNSIAESFRSDSARIPGWLNRATPENIVRRARKHHAKGLEHAKANRWEQAAREFEEAVHCAPDQPDFNFAWGGALSRLDRINEALEAYQRELVILPGDAPTLSEFGTCLARLGRTHEAVLCLQAVLRYRPDLRFAHYNLGHALLTEHRRLDAIESFGRAIRLDPAFADAYHMRGLAYAMGNEIERSTEDLQAAAALDSKNHEALLYVGQILTGKARDLEAGQLFEIAARMAPNIALPQSVFGHFLVVHHSYELGMTYIDRALKLDPLMADAHVARGFGFLGQGKVDDAVESYRRAGELQPQNAHIAGTLLFALQHKPGVTKLDLLEAHKKWAALYRPDAPINRFEFANDPNCERKPRIGLVSADMRRHAVTFLVLRALEQLATLGYEICCYKTDRKLTDDSYSDRYKAFAKSWHDISDLDDSACAALIMKEQVDILIDLSGHTAGNRLSIFANRAAPIQLSWAGYVGTIGLDSYDGIIADPVEIPPDHDPFYVESVVRLPDCYVCYHPPVEAPEVKPLPFLEKGVFTFGCFNRPAKLNSTVASAWAKILEQAPNSRILMVYGGLNEKSTQEAVYKTLESGGLSRDRVDLVGETEQSKLLEAYTEQVDLALDPFPYSAGVTTLEAMWMGVPAVTFVGDTFAGRHSATHLTAAGLSSFCTDSVEAYIELAIDWTRRTQELAMLRAELRNKVAASPLNDPVRFGYNLDAAFTGLWKDWCTKRLMHHVQ